MRARMLVVNENSSKMCSVGVVRANKSGGPRLIHEVYGSVRCVRVSLKVKR